MTDRQAASHLLRRLTFGPTAAEVDAATRETTDATLDRLLEPPALPATPELGTDPFAADLTREQRMAARQDVRKQTTEATLWWLGRMAAGGATSVAEKLTFFWHGHWATSVQKVRSARLMVAQQQTFRRYGAGDTSPLVRAMLRDPALILWLDGQKNTRKAPNENLARELMELFTLGVGNYTEDDVKAGAKLLTGWKVDRATGRATLAGPRHDATPATLLGTNGVTDVDAYADVLVRNPAHLPFITARLWLRYGSTDQPAPKPAGTRDVTAMLRALVGSAEFAGTRGRLVKQPVEWLVGAMRQLGIKPDAKVGGILRALGQVPFRPPSVGGWPAGNAWLTTSSAQARLKAGQQLVALAPAAAEGLTGGERLDALAHLLVVDVWTDRTRAALTQVKDPRKLLALALATPEYTVH
ncbi:DUF1800 domain-containing protein [Actinoplanes sp. NPDC051470]|uniref:DUF1800 domain-containing protein n=1 Tax=Actinoplanes sp. NPDC051470 TaxID=3157224 RepID=UPI003439C407